MTSTTYETASSTGDSAAIDCTSYSPTPPKNEVMTWAAITISRDSARTAPPTLAMRPVAVSNQLDS
jgi:hypothetical protein